MRWRTLKGPGANRSAEPKPQAPHELLEVSTSAAAAEIKHAYRQLVRVYHPDAVHPFLRQRSEEMMKRLNAAYRSMMSTARR